MPLLLAEYCVLSEIIFTKAWRLLPGIVIVVDI